MKTNGILIALALGASACLLAAQDTNPAPGAPGTLPPPGGPGGPPAPMPAPAPSLAQPEPGVPGGPGTLAPAHPQDPFAGPGPRGPRGQRQPRAYPQDDFRPRMGGPGGPGMMASGPEFGGERGRPMGPGGPGGPGGSWGPGRPGGPGGVHFLPPRAMEQLNLSPEQHQQVLALERELHGRLEQILSPQQMEQLRQFRPGANRGQARGEGGPNSFANPGQPGGPGPFGPPAGGPPPMGGRFAPAPGAFGPPQGGPQGPGAGRFGPPPGSFGGPGGYAPPQGGPQGPGGFGPQYRGPGPEESWDDQGEPAQPPAGGPQPG